MDQLPPDLRHKRLLRPRRNGWTATRMVAFLDELSASRCVAYAAAAAGMSRESAYRLRRRASGARFAAAWDMAIRGLVPGEQPGQSSEGHTPDHTHTQGRTATAQGHAQDHAQGHAVPAISPVFDAAVRRSIVAKIGSHEGQGHTRDHASTPWRAAETTPHCQACPEPANQ